MFYSRRLKCSAAIVGMAAATAIATAALAHPGDDWAGVSGPPLATGEMENDVQLNSDRVKFQTKDSTTLRAQTLTFTAGAHTSWHHHPGITFVVVGAGSLTVMQDDCTAHTFSAGEAFVEGDDEPHQATAGADGATIYVTYVVPTADPLVFRQDDDAPACA